MTLQGIFPQIVHLIPSIGFAWLAFDSNVEVPLEDEIEKELEA